MRQNDLEFIYWCISICVLGATVYYIATGAVNAVKVGRRLNNEQQKDNAKRELFLKLFALRGSPVHYDYVRGLNEIDIVFEDNPVVLNAWHIHYDSLQIKGQVNENGIWDLQRANLLSAMAVSLGYNQIRQTDIIRSYYPESHQHQSKWDFDLRFAAQSFFETGNIVYQMMIDKTNEDDKTKEGQQPLESEK